MLIELASAADLDIVDAILKSTANETVDSFKYVVPGRVLTCADALRAATFVDRYVIFAPLPTFISRTVPPSFHCHGL